MQIICTELTTIFAQLSHSFTHTLIYYLYKNRTAVKKSIRIGVALVVAIGIVLGAFYLSQGKEEDEKSSKDMLVVNNQNTQGEIATLDSDGDGIPDWEEELRETVFTQITTPTTTGFTYGTSSDYTPPTTFTGQFTEAFMEDYLQGKIDGVDYSDPQQFVERAINTVNANVESKKYGRHQLAIVSATEESMRKYGNDVAIVVKKHSLNNTEHELVIVQSALQNGDVARLEELTPLIFSYQNILADLLVVEVPDVLALEHVAFLNTIQEIIDSLYAMQDIFNDPLYGLARINTYITVTQGVSKYFIGVADILTENGVVFSREEEGSFFYIFDTI